jgi:hypothetical protein
VTAPTLIVSDLLTERYDFIVVDERETLREEGFPEPLFAVVVSSKFYRSFREKCPEAHNSELAETCYAHAQKTDCDHFTGSSIRP